MRKILFRSSFKGLNIALSFGCFIADKQIKPFVPNAPFLYTLKTSENLTAFWCFQGLEKGYIGNKWVKDKQSSLVGNIRKLVWGYNFTSEAFSEKD